MNLAGAGNYFVPAVYGAYRGYRAVQDYRSKPPRTSVKDVSRGNAAVNQLLAAADAQRAAAYNQGRNARIGGLIDIEKKFLDCVRADTALTTSWALLAPSSGSTNNISIPAQGDGPSSRDGRVYTIHSIHVKGRLSVDPAKGAANPLGGSIVRVVLVWDTQANGAAPTTDKIFSTVTSVLSFRNLENSRRFIILKDKQYHVNPLPLAEAANVFATAGGDRTFKMNKSFKNGIKVRTQGDTADIASAADTAFHLLGIYDGGQVVKLAYQSRLRFTG